MTVIAYKDGILASDGRSTTNWGMIAEEAINKIVYVKSLKGWIGFAGNQTPLRRINEFEGRTVLELWEWCNLLIGGMTDEESKKYSAMFVYEKRPTQIWTFYRECSPTQITRKFYAIGSGMESAMGAMEAGASAIWAVRIAIKYNNGCGGKIRHVRLK